MSKYYWNKIGSITDSPGIYAWYYSLSLARKDIDDLIEKVLKLNKEKKMNESYACVENFLNEKIFQFFIEDSYSVELKGKLKPIYNGELHHQLGPSKALVERLTEKPERLHEIGGKIVNAAPFFLNPIYIGKSKQLCTRLKSHKNLIKDYRNKHYINVLNSQTSEDDDEAEKDKVFAQQVVKRKIPPERLFVQVWIMDENLIVDLENILNRICYPIFGRN